VVRRALLSAGRRENRSRVWMGDDLNNASGVGNLSSIIPSVLDKTIPWEEGVIGNTSGMGEWVLNIVERTHSRVTEGEMEPSGCQKGVMRPLTVSG